MNRSKLWVFCAAMVLMCGCRPGGTAGAGDASGFCQPDSASAGAVTPAVLGDRVLAVTTFSGLVLVDSTGRSPVPGSEGASGFTWDRSGDGLFVTKRDGYLGYLPLGGGELRELPGEWRHVRFPAVSPDGQTLALSVNLTDDTARDWEVWLTTLDGSDPRFVVAGYQPSWTPDGDALFIEQHEPVMRLARIELENGVVTGFASETERDIGVEISPLGTFAAFSRGHERRLMLHRFEDSTLVTLTVGQGADQYPSFSPDESLVAFHRQARPPDGSVELQVVVCELGSGRSTVVADGDVIEAAFAPRSD